MLPPPHSEETEPGLAFEIEVETTPVAGECVVIFLTNDISGFSDMPTVGSTDEDDNPDGNVWDFVTSIEETANQRLYAYVCLAPIAELTKVKATFGGVVGSLGIQALRISGGNMMMPSSAANWQVTPGLGTDDVTSTNLMPTSAPGLLLGCSICTHTVSGGTPAAGTDFNSIVSMWNFSGFDNARSEYKSFASDAALAALFTATGNRDHLTIGLSISYSPLKSVNPMFGCW